MTCCCWRHLPLEREAVSVPCAMLEVLSVSATSLFRPPPPPTPRIMFVKLLNQGWQRWKTSVRFECSLIYLHAWQTDRKNLEVFKYALFTSPSSRCLGFRSRRKDLLPLWGFRCWELTGSRCSQPPHRNSVGFSGCESAHQCQDSALAVARSHKAGNWIQACLHSAPD